MLQIKRKLSIGLSIFTCFLFLETVAQPSLLKDINTGTQYTVGSLPDKLTSCNGMLFFSAYDGASGTELWKSDGTETGTLLVKDIAKASSYPSYLTSVNNLLYFSATNETHGTELWKSDGTDAGTQLIDIVPGSDGSSPQWLTNINGVVYFIASDPVHGAELWKSDGTETGTSIVKDIFPGASNSFSGFTNPFVQLNSTLFFIANDGVSGTELWKTDGTEPGTVMVKDITSGSSSSQFVNLTAIGNTLYFSVNDGVHGQEIWTSNGTAAGTNLLKDISPGVGNTPTGPPVTFKGKIFFIAYTGAPNYQLWETDGSETGTTLVSNAIDQPIGALLEIIKVSNDKMYFATGDNNHSQLWASDGTEAGTMLVKQFASSVDGMILDPLGTTLYFTAVDSEHGQELWKSDGTEVGTVLVKDIDDIESSSPRQLTTMGSKIFFGAKDGVNGEELWVTDGTTDGTKMVKNINTTLRYYPVELRATGNRLNFINHHNESTYEVWQSDGTTEGTTLVKDIKPGDVRYSGGGTQVSDAKFYMVLDDGEHGFEIWVSDGTSEGTKLLKDIRPGSDTSNPSLPEKKVVLNGYFFFEADDGVNGSALWKTDGTEAGTVMVKTIVTFGSSYIDHMLSADNMIYFVTAFALWKSDGTEAGTVMVKEMNPTHNGYAPGNLYNNRGTLFFTATDGVHGTELWKSDGTEAGTVMVKDIHADSIDHFPSIVGDVDGELLFNAAVTGYDYQLWKSNGTEAGTTLVTTVVTYAERIAQDDQYVYFTAGDTNHGNELWKSDGTDAGTVLVKDILPGIGSSGSSQGVWCKGKLYFSATDGVHGNELWRTDGTEAGTMLVWDINSGENSSMSNDLSYLTTVNDQIFFLADDGIHGREIWKFDPSFQSITFNPLADKVFNDAPFNLTASAYSGLPVSFRVISGPVTLSSNTITITGAGEVVIRASQDGNSDFNSAEPIDRSFQIAKASQVISFEALTDKNSTDQPFEINATSSSELPVSFSIESGPATISQSTITLTGEGEVIVKATQLGNNFYSAAEDVFQSFTVKLILGAEGAQSDVATVYPNPTSGSLFLDVPENVTNFSATLFNNAGEKVWDPQSTFYLSHSIFCINNLSRGVYLLRIQQRDKVSFKKIIVE